MPEISLIVPVYNVEGYLSTCIDSILTQKSADFELILIDDGSTDRSGSICDQYARKDPRIRVTHQENAGQAAARNAGLDQAVGRFILFVDADDYIEDNMLKTLLSAQEFTHADMVLCGYKRILGDEIEEKPLFNRVISSSDFWRYAHNKQYLVACVMTCNKLIRREVFDELRFQEGIINEDTNIIFPMVSACSTITFIKNCLYCYRIREGSTMTSAYTIKRARVIYDYTYRARKLMEQNAGKYAAGAVLCAIDELKVAYDQLGISSLAPYKTDIEAVYHRIPKQYFSNADRLKSNLLLRMPYLYIILRRAAMILAELRSGNIRYAASLCVSKYDGLFNLKSHK